MIVSIVSVITFILMTSSSYSMNLNYFCELKKGNHTTLENSINVFYPKTLLVIKHQKHVILKIGERKTKLENYKTKNLKLLNPDKEYSSKELSSIKNTVSKNSYSGNHYYGDSWTLDFILTEDYPNKRYLARLVELGSVDIKFGIYKCNKIDF